MPRKEVSVHRTGDYARVIKVLFVHWRVKRMETWGDRRALDRTVELITISPKDSCSHWHGSVILHG